MKFSIHQTSHYGARPYNQDRLAYSYTKDALLMVVADGMGGYRHGEVAAQLAVKSLTDAFEELALPVLKNPVEFLNSSILQIHEAIGGFALTNELLEAPRSTVVVAILQQDTLYCARVGDSRLYHFRDDKLLYRTEDHSIVQIMLRRGQIDKQAMHNHPDRNKIYNCLGGEKQPQIDQAQTRNLRDGDLLLLCSDGLWSSLSDERIGEILQNGALSQSIPNLVALAEALNGENSDNISAIGMLWGDQHEASQNKLAISTVSMPLGAATTIINPNVHHPTIRNDENLDADHQDLTDDEIEKAIAEIQAAINKF